MAIQKDEQFTSPSGVPYDYSATISSLTPNANLLTPDTTKITADSLKNTPAMDFKTANVLPPADISKLDTTVPDLIATEQEQKQSSLSDTIQGLRTSLLGESAVRATAEEKQDIPGMIKTQSDLSSQLKAIQNEAQAIPLQMQQDATGKGITAGGLRPLETARLRTNAIQALGVSSLLEASRGNLATAQTLADRAVAQKYDPIKAELAASIANLETIANDPRTSLQDKNRANKQLALQKAKDAEITKQADDAKTILTTAQEAAKNGADALTLQKIQNAKTPLEAITAAGKFSGKQDTSITEVGGKNLLINNQTGETIKDLGTSGDVTASLMEKYPDAGILPTDDIATAQGKLKDSAIYQKDIESAGGAGEKIVTINGKQYVQGKDAEGNATFINPDVAGETSEADTSAADAMINSINELNKIGINNDTVGTLRAKLYRVKPGTKASNLNILLESIVGAETLKNMGLIKGVLSDSDMKLLKAASTQGLNADLSPELFKKQLGILQSSALAVANKKLIQDSLEPAGWPPVELGDNFYGYRNLDGTVHVGQKGDNYKDKTSPTLNLDFQGVDSDTNKAVSTETIGTKKIVATTTLLDKLKKADEDFFNATGKHIDINQSFRTRQQQEKLFKELSAKGARVAPPGKSFHEKGLAIDVSNWKEAQVYLRKYGLLNELSDDRGHFSLGEFKNKA